MEKTTFKKASQIMSHLNNLEAAKDCFFWSPNPDLVTVPDENGNQKIFSTEPEIIIEYNGDGRETRKIPGILGDDLIKIIIDHINQQIEKLEKELDAL